MYRTQFHHEHELKIYYITNNALSGGAGEGVQHLVPEGTQNNPQQVTVKSDETLPFYCHPPKPMPQGILTYV